MISLLWGSSFQSDSYDADRHIQELIRAYGELPRHMARKHMGAAMRRTVRPGVSVLRKHTPPLGVRRGRRKAGEKQRSSGAMRAAVTVRVTQTRANQSRGASVSGILGYKAGPQSRKAIWFQYGTSRRLRAYDMIGKTMAEIGQPAAATLAREMAEALEKATKELAGGRNPGRGG